MKSLKENEELKNQALPDVKEARLEMHTDSEGGFQSQETLKARGGGGWGWVGRAGLEKQRHLKVKAAR